jgi:hypothetical protein
MTHPKFKIEVCYDGDTDPFITWVEGAVTVSLLEEIEAMIVGDIFEFCDKGFGAYIFEVSDVLCDGAGGGTGHYWEPVCSKFTKSERLAKAEVSSWRVGT